MNEIYKADCDTCIGGFKRILENGSIDFEEKYDKAIYDGGDVYNKLF